MTVTEATDVTEETGCLPWRVHLRICRSSVLSHRMYLVYAVLFPVLIVVMASESAWYRVAVVVVFGLLPSGLVAKVTLTGEQLRAFGFTTADQRRHRITVILVTTAGCVVGFGVDAAAIALSGGLPWWGLGAGAVLALVLLAVRAIPSGASGDIPTDKGRAPGRSDIRPVTASAGHRPLLVSAVRRRWRPVLWAVGVLVVGQIVVRAVLPGAAETAMTMVMLAIGMVAITVGQGLSEVFTTMLVFGCSRKVWMSVMLREAAVVPAVGMAGAAVAIGLDAELVGQLGWVRASPLLAIHAPMDVVLILIAGAASGVVVLMVSTASVLVLRVFPGWASLIAVAVGSASVVGLLFLVWSPGSEERRGPWLTWTGGPLVLVVGSLVVVPFLVWLTSRCSVRTDGDTATWLGLRTTKNVRA